jgi:HSP20 family molecular chaperone IbpA
MSDENALRTRDKQELQGEGTRPGPVFRPDIDILERSDAYLIYADLPGVDEQSVDVRLDRGALSIDAQLATLPGEGWTPLHTEYRLGSYHRDFRISEDIDAGAVSARVSNGVLELLLPKSAARQPRAIRVQAG